jgi:flagellar basal body L-ring protein FlgH
MAVDVAQITANGDLVLEGRRQSWVDGKIISQTLKGIVSQEQVRADRAVLGRNISNLVVVTDGSGAAARGEDR